MTPDKAIHPLARLVANHTNHAVSLSPTIESQWSRSKYHPSGFDYMRIALAVAVLLWHSYQVSYGTPAALEVWQTPAGLMLQLILPMFFCLSGFLVSGSLERNHDLRKFLKLRVIRIYPALCVEVFVSALIMGPIVTSYSTHVYFTSKRFFSYFLNTIGWIHFTLPGVFVDNPFHNTVNASLWTVPYELECYILLSLLVLIGYMKSKLTSIILFIFSTFVVIVLLHASGESGAPLGGIHGRVLVLCFLAGTIVFRFREAIPYNGKLAALAIIVSVPMLRYNYSVFFAPLFMAYVTVYLGLMNPRKTVIVKSGDYSYGVYLYAAPIQQTVAWALGSTNNWLINVLISLPATVGLALFSWHCVEKQFLRVKKYVLAKSG